MALNKENFALKDKNELESVKNMLKDSSIYRNISSILNAYNLEQKLRNDELFSNRSSNGDSLFSVVKYVEAKRLLDSGKLQKEISSLEDRVKNHKYIIAKNREKDSQSLNDLVKKEDKIKTYVCLVETKNQWNKIVEEKYPSGERQNWVHSLDYFMDIYKDLSINLEKTCYRHLGDKNFVKKLNAEMESDLSNPETSTEQGKDDYTFALKAREAFVKILNENRAKYVLAQKDNANYQNENN